MLSISFFVSVGDKVSSTIVLRGDEKDICDYLGPKVTHSIFLEPVTEGEIALLIDRIKVNKSYGPDLIHPRFLKDAKLYILAPLTHIINLSIMQDCIPDNMKIARVVPIFKGGDPKIMGNYRPISILPAISKLLERCVANRLLKFLDKTIFFYELQSGFHKA